MFQRSNNRKRRVGGSLMSMLISLGITSTQLAFTRVALADGCPCTIWSGSAAPAGLPSTTTDAYELGVKFRADRGGFISGARFYKLAGATGAHIVSLWTSDGTLLASARFTNEGESGWQQVSFGSAVPITANVTYVVSYHADHGPLAADVGYFAENQPATASPLRALADGEDGPNGLYRAGPSGFPAQSYYATNYYVDAIFVDTPGAAGNATYSGKSLFADTTTPAISADDHPVELGMQFRSAEPGYITAVRYYKSSANTGVHPGSLWTADGQLLARVTFTEETAEGWQEARLAHAVPIAAHTPYVVSYHTDTCHPALQVGAFEQPAFAYPLYAPASAAVNGNGLYRYTGSPDFPNQSWNAANYFVDVVFASEPLPPLDATQGTAKNLWTTIVTPPFAPAWDSYPAELGVKFQSARDGYISGVRFFKGPQNTGTHLGNLWDADGNLLASAMFTNETADGWQEVTFAHSVPISANATYVASYHLDHGGWAYGYGYFASSGYERAPLRAPAGSEAGGNGVYKNGASGFPTQTYDNTNYWVDVVFADAPADEPPVVDHATIWPDTAQPAIPSAPNDTPVQIGVKVRADRDGVIHGMHYFNGDDTATTHTAKLWTSTGTLLASVPFTNAPAVGWQNVLFASPASVTANTTYVISYDTARPLPRSDWVMGAVPPSASPAIRALADGEDGGNSVYSYGAGFPDNTYPSNYWVDVIFSSQSYIDSLSNGVVACGQTSVHGVDVSNLNGSIDWNAVEAAGIQFAFIKATQGTSFVDPRFAANWSDAKSAGVLRAPYHFFDPTVSGAVQAQHFLATIGALGDGDLPPALDLECPDGLSNCLGYPGGSGWAPGDTIRSGVLEWLSAVEQGTGKKPIIYTTFAYFDGAQMSAAGLGDYPLWQAMIEPSNGCFQVPSPWTKWTFWQNSWQGAVAGIPGQVDLDTFGGTLAELVALASGGGGGGPPPSTCPYGDGLYCGGNGVQGNPLVLYSCQGGALTPVEACSLGCQYMPAGQNDQCATGTACPQGDGLYCGAHQVGGNPGVLYECAAGALSPVTTCAAGCTWMPDGQNDQCT